MAGQSLKSSPSFGSGTAAVYVFNLIVGTGALALPAAFAAAGWAAGALLLVVLAALSYITASWVVEAMAACNAIIRIQIKTFGLHFQQSISSHQVTDLEEGDREEEKEAPNFFEEPDDNDSAYLVRNDMSGQVSVASYGAVRAVSTQESVFELKQQLELAKMSEMLYNRWGRIGFNLCMAAYLFGDLAIYITAVSKSLRDVSCGAAGGGNITNSGINSSSQDINDPCWSTRPQLSKADVYKIFVAVFLLVLGPFAYFNVSKTKYLQIFTTLMRWTAFITMITLSILRITDDSQEHGEPPILDLSTAPMVFGVSVYAFMCHHSIPSLITPIENKTKVAGILAADYALIATFYLLLSFTGIFAFPSVPDLYTLAFSPSQGTEASLPTQIADYFLALFPVFTLSTNFPIIAITLRNNIDTILTEASGRIAGLSPGIRRLLFPTVAILPPALVALATENLGVLVSITGAFAGAGIQYIIPCSLVWLARRKLNQFGQELNLNFRNPLESYFKHTGFIIMIVVWSLVAVGLVTANFIIKAVK